MVRAEIQHQSKKAAVQGCKGYQEEENVNLTCRKIDQDVGISRAHSLLVKRRMQYAAPLAIQKIIEKKCQCRPIPRFLWPGNATQEENDSSSSRAIHTLFLKSDEKSFFVNFIHSVQGVAWSCQ
jgi:hypothetical protein